MKSIVSITLSAAFVLGMALPAIAGPVGMQRSYTTTTTTYQDTAYATPWQAYEDLAQLENASGEARVAAQGSKNRSPFMNRSYEIDSLIQRIENGEPVQQSRVDDALQPIVLN
jgi:hypothetical protein